MWNNFPLKFKIKIHLGYQKLNSLYFMFTAWWWNVNRAYLNQRIQIKPVSLREEWAEADRRRRARRVQYMQQRNWKSWGHPASHSALHIYSTTSRGSRQLRVSGGPGEREEWREKERARVSTGLRGAEQQVICGPLKWQSTGVNKRTLRYDSQGK